MTFRINFFYRHLNQPHKTFFNRVIVIVTVKVCASNNLFFCINYVKYGTNDVSNLLNLALCTYNVYLQYSHYHIPCYIEMIKFGEQQIQILLFIVSFELSVHHYTVPRYVCINLEVSFHNKNILWRLRLAWNFVDYAVQYVKYLVEFS